MSSETKPKTASTPPSVIGKGAVRLTHLQRAKREGRKLAMLTAYDALTAQLLDAAGVDMLLVGDSLSNVTLGYKSTLEVTLDDMARATSAVARGSSRAFIVTDLPFGTYETSPQDAFRSSVKLMQSGAHAVKLEGGIARSEIVRFLVEAGVPVMGHLGYTPQSEHILGGPSLQGKGDKRQQLLADALALQEAGAFAIVLEMIPASLAAEITEALEILTIGIGAGPNCDGQVLVWSDAVGMSEWTPSFVKRFAEIGQQITQAASEYVREVREGTYPNETYSREN